MIRSVTILAAAAACLSAGCSEPSTLTSLHVTELDGLQLELTVDRPVISVGDSGTVTMRLHNSTAEPVRLQFGSGCQIMPYIEDPAGAIQVPGGGAWACSAILTALEVPARGSVTRTLTVRGVERREALSFAALEPGAYRAYALLGAMSGGRQLRSPTVAFEVR